MKPLYFAYGSNLSAAQMQSRCPSSVKRGIGCLNGFRLSFTRYSRKWGGGVADVLASAGNEVWGFVYQLEISDLEALDECEGVPHAYNRFQTSICMDTEIYDGVWVYSVTAKAEFIRPSAAYMQIIETAAEEFPPSYRAYLKRLLEEAVEPRGAAILRTD